MPVTQRDIVLFLGAGFSWDAKLPLMGDFRPAARLDQFQLERYVDPRSSQHRLMAPELVAAARTYEAFVQLCADTEAIPVNRLDNIEEVYCVAEALDQAGLSSIQLGDSCRTLDEVVRAIALWIWKIYHQVPLFNPKKGANRDTYAAFFKTLRDLQLASRVTVITTNYDIIFEWLAWENAMPCSYPIKWDEGFRAGSGRDVFVLPSNAHRSGILICKLHGSINYFVDEDDASELYVAANISDGNPIGRSKLKAGRPAVMAVDSLAALRDHRSSLLVPSIIPPSYSKLERTTWLRTIWSHALTALRAARCIVFVGYSMPPTDGFIRALIGGAMATRDTTKPPQIAVVDPCEDVHKRFQAAFGDRVLDLPHQSLAAAADTLIPNVLRECYCLNASIG